MILLILVSCEVKFLSFSFVFFFNDTATTEIYTLSLHDALPISRASVLTGQVLGSLIRTMITIVLVLGVALLMGFRPTTHPVAWIAALGVIALFTLALTW